jgi:heat shock protein beta
MGRGGLWSLALAAAALAEPAWAACGTGDVDGDGLADRAEDLDADGDCDDDDTDRDGVPDYLDADDDGDGVPSVWEVKLDREDGVLDGVHLDRDFDVDAIEDLTEWDFDAWSRGALPDFAAGPTDTDLDGTPDILDTDDDGDGIRTIVEGPWDEDRGPVGEGPCEDWGPNATCHYCVLALPDGLPNYLDLDSDGDGVPDADEAADQDHDAIPDFRDCYHCDTPVSRDCDEDGLSERHELDLGADDRDPDVDDDGLADGCEVGERAELIDTDGDGVGDLFDPDNDGDGLGSAHEGGSVPAPRTCLHTPVSDTDGDGVPDPWDPDDDGDGVFTRFEACDPDTDGSPADARDTNVDGVPDYLDADDDGDECPTVDEGPDPDGDGDPSDAEDSDGDGIDDWLDPDCGQDTGAPSDTGDGGEPGDTADTDREAVRIACGCATADGQWGAVLLAALLGVGRRRRARGDRA